MIPVVQSDENGDIDTKVYSQQSYGRFYSVSWTW
jgi:hypothetical protein